jgi:undecaprenyl-diphosphatase
MFPRLRMRAAAFTLGPRSHPCECGCVTKGKSWLLGLAVLAAAVYAAMWIGWTTPWAWITDVDTSMLAAAHRKGVENHAWVTFWDAVCTVFSPLTFRLVTLGVIVYAFVRRQRRIAIFLLLAVEMSAVLTEVTKWLADRPRPATAMVYAASTSFPSGHALGVMVCVLALAIVLAPYVRRRLWPWLVAAGVLVVVAVGVGRVALNVHHPSDVVAGWALGYLWFLACLPVLGGGVTAVRATAETPEARGSER